MPQKSYKDILSFCFLKNREDNSSSSNEVFLVEKIKNGNKKGCWYAKYLNGDGITAILETIAQEFYRLILSQQPKTRRIISKTKMGVLEYHVVSKAIPQFDDKFFIPSEECDYVNEKKIKNIIEGKITGLAATQVLALLLNEVDFKANNVGVDGDGRVIKIDGGLCLVKLNPQFEYLEGKNFGITQIDLETLPNLVNYEACNWLNQIQWAQHLELSLKNDPTEYEACNWLNQIQWAQHLELSLKNDPTEIDERINQSPYFKDELYQTILCIISLPDQLIQFFTQSYTTDLTDVAIISDFIIDRKKQLAQAAKQIPAFNEYCQSDQAREGIIGYLNYLKTFKTMGKSFLLSEFEAQYKINIEATLLDNVLKEYTSIKSFTIKLDNYLVNFKINLDTSESKQEGSPAERIISAIMSLKTIISEYLISPTILNKNALYATLGDFLAETIKEETVTKNSIISDLIESINKLLDKNDGFKKNPVPTLHPFALFFKNNSQTVSTVYHDEYDGGTQVQLTLR